MSQLKRYNGTNWENIGGSIAPKTYKTNSDTYSYSCNYINEMTSYSTNEIVVGTWIDNKPIYRKVYEITSGITKRTELDLDVSSLNIDTCLKVGGWQQDSYFGHVDLIYYFSASDYNYIYLLGKHTIKYRYNWDADKIYIVLEYTKTTD